MPAFLVRLWATFHLTLCSAQLKSRYFNGQRRQDVTEHKDTRDEVSDFCGSSCTGAENMHTMYKRQPVKNTASSSSDAGTNLKCVAQGECEKPLQQPDTNAQSLMHCDAASTSGHCHVGPGSSLQQLSSSSIDFALKRSRDSERGTVSDEWSSVQLMSWLVALLRRNYGTLSVDECDAAMVDLGARAALSKVGGWRSLCGRTCNKHLILYRRGRISLRQNTTSDERSRGIYLHELSTNASSACELTVTPPLNMLDLIHARGSNSLPGGALIISESPLPRPGTALYSRKSQVLSSSVHDELFDCRLVLSESKLSRLSDGGALQQHCR